MHDDHGGHQPNDVGHEPSVEVQLGAAIAYTAGRENAGEEKRCKEGNGGQKGENNKEEDIKKIEG